MNQGSVEVAGEIAIFQWGAAPLDFALPSIPETEWADLKPVAGQNMGLALARSPKNTRAHLPAGTYTVIDNAMTNNYSVYAPASAGLRGDGPDKTIIRMQPNSFKTLAVRPKQAGSGLMRLGPNGGASGIQRTISDLSFIGAPQAGADGLPMFAGGYQNYWGRKEFWKNVRVLGLAYGGGNSPNTGETFMVNCYRDVDSTFIDCDFDGRDEQGNLISGSPMGMNGSTNATFIRCKFHDSLFSGPTASIAGDLTSPTNGFSMIDCDIWNNANHSWVTASGRRFAGINMEHVTGNVLIQRTSIAIDPSMASLWDAAHVSVGSSIGDNKTILIDSPKWTGSPAWLGGAFNVAMWGKQTTPPVVKNPNGSLKQPVVINDPKHTPVKIDPETQYACTVNADYVAP